MSPTSSHSLLYSSQVKQDSKAHLKVSSMYDYKKYLCQYFKHHPLSFIHQPPHLSTNSCQLANLYSYLLEVWLSGPNTLFKHGKQTVLYSNKCILDFSLITRNPNLQIKYLGKVERMHENNVKITSRQT